MIRAAAPGKVVLWGEYAVLTGAPAMVMAVNRYARCEVRPAGETWEFAAKGYTAPGAAIRREQLVGPTPPPQGAVWNLAWHVLQSLDRPALPAGGRILCDTEAFQESGRKLGLGSSAALAVALHGAFTRLLGLPPSYDLALAAHRQFQRGAGSGIDVAAAWHGGTLMFRRAGVGSDDAGQAMPWPLPAGLHLRFVFSGRSASTTGHLARFERWLGRDGDRELGALAAAATSLFETGDAIDALERYVAALQALDEAADLGIFSAPHRRLRQLAIQAGVVYKPCGAGGGDVGAAFAADSAAAERFTQLTTDNGFLPIPLETAPHGIEVTG